MIEMVGAILLMLFSCTVGMIWVIAALGQDILNVYERLRAIRNEHKES